MEPPLEQRVPNRWARSSGSAGCGASCSPQVAEAMRLGRRGELLESHRREVTVVFCDLRGFTAFTETAEPEEVMAVLREYHAALGTIIHSRARSSASSATASWCCSTIRCPLHTAIRFFHLLTTVFAISDWTGTIGLPIPSTEVSILDEAGKELPTGQVGEICVRGPQVMKGYWNQPGENAKKRSSTGGCAPATWATWTSGASSRSPTARRTSSSSPASTSIRTKSRTWSCCIRASWKSRP